MTREEKYLEEVLAAWDLLTNNKQALRHVDDLREKFLTAVSLGDRRDRAMTYLTLGYFSGAVQVGVLTKDTPRLLGEEGETIPGIISTNQWSIRSGGFAFLNPQRVCGVGPLFEGVLSALRGHLEADPYEGFSLH